MHSSSFSSRGSQRRRSAISVDSAIDVEEQQSSDEVEDLPRPAKKRQKRPPTATVTTVQPVFSPRKRPATDDEVAGKADTSQKKHRKRRRQTEVEKEAEQVIPPSPPKKKNKNKNKEKYTGVWLADLAKDRLYNNLKKTKVAHV